MSKPRFYCSDLPTPTLRPDALSDTIVALDRDQSHHARKVLRLEQGDQLVLFDGLGAVAHGVIAALDSDVLVRLVSIETVPPPAPHLTVAAAFPKGPRADDMVHMLTQAGCNTLIPLMVERTVVEPRQNKLDRLAAAAVETAKQSRRSHLMKIEKPRALPLVLAGGFDIKMVCDPDGESRHAHRVAEELPKAQRALVIIGPEGGLTPDELDRCFGADCIRWRIAPNILRIETAATVAAGLVRYLAANG